jgi:hypothetical protein
VIDVLILTFEYEDKSAFRICGATQSYQVARAWLAAGDGQHKVYRLQIDSFKNRSEGWETWDA